MRCIHSQIWQYCGLKLGILGTQSPKFVRLKEINWSLKEFIVSKCDLKQLLLKRYHLIKVSFNYIKQLVQSFPVWVVIVIQIGLGILVHRKSIQKGEEGKGKGTVGELGKGEYKFHT